MNLKNEFLAGATEGMRPENLGRTFAGMIFMCMGAAFMGFSVPQTFGAMLMLVAVNCATDHS